MSRADDVNMDLWRTLAKYDLEDYTDALMDVLPDWLHEDDEEEDDD